MRKTVHAISLAFIAIFALAFLPRTEAPVNSFTVRIMGTEDVQVNTLIYSTFRFTPGMIHVSQGAVVTFPNLTPDPHTVSVVDPSQLPSNFEEIFECTSPGAPCFQFLLGHFPLGPEGPPDSIVPVLNVGAPGLDAPGDSIFVLPPGFAFPGFTNQVTISAAPGTTLHYLCALHPWMQGSIVVQ